MRLIDADNFFARMENDIDLCAEMETDGLKALKRYLDIQPTAYSVDKVVEELEKQKIGLTEWAEDEAFKLAIHKAIEIVKQGGVSADVCEWHKVKNGNAYKCNTHAEIHDSRVLDWCKCPYCGKKIKVVE